MKTVDVPGAFRLEQIRAAVRTVAEGTRSSTLVREAMGIAPRHVSFALSSARILGWLRGDSRSWSVTDTGRRLLRTQAGSADETRAFEDAIRRSAAIRTIAPRILDDTAPSFGKLVWRIARLSAMSDASARRGARVLLSWRRQALGLETSAAAVEPGGEVILLMSLALRGLGPFRHASTPLGPFTVLAGPSGAGMSSALDAPFFLADAERLGLGHALGARCARFDELLWSGRSESLAVAVEASLPPSLRPDPSLDRIRLELELVPDGESNAKVAWEAVFLAAPGEPAEIVTHRGRPQPASWQAVVLRGEDHVTRYVSERDEWSCVFPVPSDRLALSSLPADHERFPGTLRLRDLLQHGIARMDLRTEAVAGAATPELTVRDGRTVPARRASAGVMRAAALLALATARSREPVTIIDDLGDGIDQSALGGIIEKLVEIEGRQVIAATTSLTVIAGVPLENLVVLVHDGDETTFVPGIRHRGVQEWRSRVDRAALLGGPFSAGA
jgi:hypothetical protein